MCLRKKQQPGKRAQVIKRAGCLLVCIFLPVLIGATCSDVTAPNRVRIVSYNVKASFGDTERRALLPENIALAVQEIGGAAPDILLLQEIEDADVVPQLVREHLIGSGYRYQAVSTEGALRVGVCSRYPLSGVRFHRMHDSRLPDTRGFLEVAVAVNDMPIYIFLAHLKSKRGGARATEPQRVAVFTSISKRVQEIIAQDIRATVIIAGDLNEEIAPADGGGAGYPTALMEYAGDIDFAPTYPLADKQVHTRAEIVPIEHAERLPLGAANILVSPWDDAEWPGSYYYGDEWQRIDHFLLSPSLFDDQLFDYADFAVAATPVLLDDNGLPAGVFSDHLPIVLELEW